jgi:diguanylate cyclase (GGDEF)-like protein
MEVLVAEPSLPLSNALRKFLDGTGEVFLARYLDEAVHLLHEKAPGVLLASVSGNFDGEVLCARVKRQSPATGVVLVYPADDLHEAATRAAQAGADAFLVGPLKKHVVVSVVKAVWAVHQLQGRVRVSEAEVLTLKTQLAKEQAKVEALKAQPAKGEKGTDEAFFKRYMLLELKRSKRYQYPVSLLLVALDRLEAHLAQDAQPEVRRAAIRSEALATITQVIRDIDIAMPFGDDKYLVFLPHTGRGGALSAARRLLEPLKRLPAYIEGSASVGVAAYEPQVGEGKQAVSFAALVREAAEMLRKAHAAGGNQVESRLEHPPALKGKRSRIVMG